MNFNQECCAAGFPAHPSIPINPELVYCCASATLQAATVDAAASSKAHCHHRTSQVHLLAAVSAIAETNQELVASKHQGIISFLLHRSSLPNPSSVHYIILVHFIGHHFVILVQFTPLFLLF